MNRRHLTRITALLVTCTVAAGCGRSADSPETSRTAGDLRSTTTAATKDADPITWAVYRDVQTIDPLYVFDYPDNTALTLFCESLLRTQPDGTITDGLASLSRTDPTTLVLDLDTLEATCRPLRWLSLTGEALPPALCTAWFARYPRIPVLNAYGPAECSDDATHHILTGPLLPDATTVPIGRALPNVRLYVLGAAGELSQQAEALSGEVASFVSQVRAA